VQLVIQQDLIADLTEPKGEANGHDDNQRRDSGPAGELGSRDVHFTKGRWLIPSVFAREDPPRTHARIVLAT
jgi:hypothetical protein